MLLTDYLRAQTWYKSGLKSQEGARGTGLCPLPEPEHELKAVCHLQPLPCPSVRPSVCPSVGPGRSRWGILCWVKYPGEEEEEEWPLDVPAGPGDTWGFGEGGDHTRVEASGAARSSSWMLQHDSHNSIPGLWCSCEIPAFGAVPSSCAHFPACWSHRQNQLWKTQSNVHYQCSWRPGWRNTDHKSHVQPRPIHCLWSGGFGFQILQFNELKSTSRSLRKSRRMKSKTVTFCWLKFQIVLKCWNKFHLQE